MFYFLAANFYRKVSGHFYLFEILPPGVARNSRS